MFEKLGYAAIPNVIVFFFQDGQSSMEALAARQDIILEKLLELRNQLGTMKKNMRVCAKPPQPKQATGGKNNKVTAESTTAPPKGRCKPKVRSKENSLE